MWKPKLLLARGRPPERALTVGDKAVHRDAHRVDQHGFKLIAPQRRTMIVTTFTIELDIGLTYLLQAALTQLVTDRETTPIVVGRPSDRTAIAGAALRSRKRNATGTLVALSRHFGGALRRACRKTGSVTCVGHGASNGTR
jgi:hypothetical protein